MHRSRLNFGTGVALLTALLFIVAPLVAVAAPTVHQDVVYGHKMGMALTYDVLEAEKPNGAGILFMVSGGWVSRWFDPNLALANRGSFSELTDRGYTVFLVRHGSSPLFKVPDAVIDVRKALDHIAENSETWGVDSSRLGVFGGSAGGHLSLMLGNANEAEVGDTGSTERRVAAVVAYFPPVDLQPIVGPNERFPALEFDKELADDISPLLYVSSDDPPTLLVHGDQDTLVPMTTSQTIHKAFQEKGVVTELVIIEGAGHGFRGEHEKIATDALIAWFDKHLKGSTGQASGGD